MCWLCRAVDHVFDTLDPYLDSGTSFKRYTYKRRLHGNTSNTPKKKTQSGSKKSKHRYIRNKNKQVVLVDKNVTANDNKNVRVNVKKEYNVYDHIYHRNKLKRASSMPIYTSRPQIVHERTMAIEGPRVKGLSRSAKDLRSRSLERSLGRRGLKRSRSEGTDIRKSGLVPNRRHIHSSKRVRRPPSRAYSYSPSRSSSRRHHSHDEIVHRRTQRDIRSQRSPYSARSARDRAIKHHTVQKQRSLKHRKEPRDSSKSRSNKYTDESVSSRKSRPIHGENTKLKSSLSRKSKNYTSREEDIVHSNTRQGGVALRHNYSESSTEESEEEDEEEEEYEEENEISSSRHHISESLRIRRELRKEYFLMMEELFVMSGDGINSKRK